MEEPSLSNNNQGRAATAMSPTSPDNTRLASSAPSQARRILWRARRDVAQHGGPLLDAALGDTFTARILGAMLAEADNYILKNNGLDSRRDGGLLPPGWAQTMLLLINKAETQVVNARRQVDALEMNDSAAASTTSTSSSSGGFLAPPFPAAPNNRIQHGHNVPPSPPPSPPLPKLVIAHSQLPPQKIGQDPSPNLAVPHIRALAGLHVEAQALLSVIAAERMRLKHDDLPSRNLPSPRIRSRRRAQTRHSASEAAFLAVLAEEEDLLLATQDHISHLYEWGLTPPARGSRAHNTCRSRDSELPLDQRLGALPVQLQAIFNMQCREQELGARSRSSSLDERRMLRIVTENQNRTEMVRRIQRILAEKRAIRLDMCLLVR